MSVGLLLQGRFSRPILDRLRKNSPKQDLLLVESWLRDHCAEALPETSIVEQDGQPALFLSLHPAAQDVEFTLGEQEQLFVDANTSTAGPGFHIFLCDALQRMGHELSIKWAPDTEDYLDETGYFRTGDRDSVCQHMCDWIEGLANLFFDGTLDASSSKLAMPMNVDFLWPNDGTLTAMGPRNLDWLKRAAASGEAGKDFFAWWNPELDAEYYLRRALARMWSDVRWRAPVNETERNQLAQVADCLERAYKLAPWLDYPWTEWLEVLQLLDRHDEHGIGNKPLQRPVIGYRRREVKVELPGSWWIQLPGSFSDFLPDEDASVALDPPREVWFTGYEFKEPGDAALASWKKEANVADRQLIVDRDGYFASASIEEKKTAEGESYFALQSSNISRQGRCICTIIFVDPADRDWAVETWKSMEPPRESA